MYLHELTLEVNKNVKATHPTLGECWFDEHNVFYWDDGKTLKSFGEDDFDGFEDDNNWVLSTPTQV